MATKDRRFRRKRIDIRASGMVSFCIVDKTAVIMIEFTPIHTDSQIAETASLARDIWQDHYTPIIGAEQVSYMLATFQSEQAIRKQIEDGYEYYLITCDQQKTGYVAVIPDANSSTLMISKIYVLKSERGKGIGKKTLEFVESLAVERQLDTLWLTVNKNNSRSIAWYEQMGFTNSGSLVQDIGEGFVMDDFRMEKKLPAAQSFRAVFPAR